MITIEFEPLEFYDSVNNQFDYVYQEPVRFEYSLLVVYEWEQKWRKSFMSKEFTYEEVKDLHRRMALDKLDERFLTDDVSRKLSEYISDSNTATTFNAGADGQNGNNISKGKLYTSEEIYALMAMENIPIEHETRNLNRLMTMLRIIGNYKNPPKKMSKADIMRQNRELNAQRRKQLNTKG